MRLQFNKFSKKASSKTAYLLIEGEPIFTETVYLLEPIYIHKRSPDFTIVSKGKHISGLFKVADNVYLGDHHKTAIILFLNEEGFDLFYCDLPPVTARQMLLDGQLNDMLFRAREEAVRA